MEIAVIEICKFTQEEIADAVLGLDGLSKLLPPLLLQQNLDGMGKQDAEECKKHLTMGKHALILLADAMEKTK